MDTANFETSFYFAIAQNRFKKLTLSAFFFLQCMPGFNFFG